jgi:hypothetical protein
MLMVKFFPGARLYFRLRTEQLPNRADYCQPASSREASLTIDKQQVSCHCESSLALVLGHTC